MWNRKASQHAQVIVVDRLEQQETKQDSWKIRESN